MKKGILFFVLVMFVSTAALSQFNQGRYLLGGSVGFSTSSNKTKSASTTTDNGSFTAFSISPTVGYFVIDNLAVGAGLSLGLSGSKSEGTIPTESHSTSVTFRPFVRYYLPMGVFGQALFGVGSSKNKYTTGNTTTENKDGITQWSIAAGYAYFLNDFVAVEPTVGVLSNTRKDKDTDFKSIDFSFFLSVGLQVYLGARR